MDKILSSSINTRVILALVSLYFIWGTTFTIIKIGLDSFSPYWMAAIRFTFAGCLLGVIALFLGWKKITKYHLAKAVPVGFLLTFSNALVCAGEEGISSGIAALLVTLVPVLMVLMNWIGFDKRAPSLISVIGLVSSIFGLYWAISSQPGMSFDIKESYALFALVASTFTWAYAALWSKQPLKRAEPLPFFQNIFLQVISGGIILSILAFFLEPNSKIIISTSGILSIVYLAAVGTVVGYTLFFFLLKNTTSEIAGTYALMNPVVAILFGVFFLREPWNIDLIYSVAIVITGVALIIFEKSIKAFFKKVQCILIYRK